MLGAIQNNQFDSGITVSEERAKKVAEHRDEVANDDSGL